MEIKIQIQKLLDSLNEGVYEKNEVIALTLLTAVAGESIFLLGAPGVAKSLIARRLKFAFKDGTSFDYLMNRFSTPDEIFGPVSISKLKDEDKYERIVKNYLPTAKVVFLDEIWKAGPSIQNALLTVLNEKIYRNGEREIKVPMKALISASNELPLKGEGLEALWDRFLVRYVVEGVTDKDNFNEMISKSLKSYEDNIAPINKLTDEQYDKISSGIDEVEIPINVFEVIHVVRHYLDQHNKKEENKENQIYISDRRWRKIVRLLRTSAFLNNRKTVDLMDCFLIIHCLWNETEQAQTIIQFVKDAIQKHGYTKKLSVNPADIFSELKELDDEVKSETSFLKPMQWLEPVVYYTNYYKIPSLKGDNYYSHHADSTLIKISDYVNLGYAYSQTHIFRDSSNERTRDQSNYFNLKRGKNDFTVVKDGNTYKLETQITEQEELYTKKPHDAVKREWDRRIKVVLTNTGNLKSQLDHFRSNDLKHLRDNLFVNEMNAELVESNLNDIQTEIEKLEVEARRIQHYYENIKGQRKIDMEPLALSEGAKPVKNFEMDELTDVEEWIINELKEQKILTAADFLNTDTNTLIDNTQIDRDTLLEIREQVVNKLQEIE